MSSRWWQFQARQLECDPNRLALQPEGEPRDDDEWHDHANLMQAAVLGCPADES